MPPNATQRTIILGLCAFTAIGLSVILQSYFPPTLFAIMAINIVATLVWIKTYLVTTGETTIDPLMNLVVSLSVPLIAGKLCRAISS